LDAPGWVILSSWANSVTGRSPARSSTRIARRCGSAIALKTSDVVAARAMAQLYSDIGMRQAGGIWGRPQRKRRAGPACADAPAAPAPPVLHERLAGHRAAEQPDAYRARWDRFIGEPSDW
jgi:hypothetical protein